MVVIYVSGLLIGKEYQCYFEFTMYKSWKKGKVV
jgi:hypothetical protein